MKVCFRIILTGIIVSLVMTIVISRSPPNFPGTYWIFFTDKNYAKSTTVSLSAFYTPEALDRRKKLDIPFKTDDWPVVPRYVDRVNEIVPALHHTTRWFNGVSVTIRDAYQRKRLLQLPFVKKVQPVRSWKFDSAPSPTPIASVKAKALPKKGSVNDGYAQNQNEMLNISALHNKGYEGKGIDIAVLDAGFRNVDTLRAFDSLYQQNRLKGTYDFVDEDTTVYESSSHGTHVLSTIASDWPGVMIGTAPAANFWLLRTEDVSREVVVEGDDWVAAAEYADRVGVDIINSSLGYFDFEGDSSDLTYQEMDGDHSLVTRGADKAASKGILVVNSAGNEGNNDWEHIIAPADGDSVFAIGAVDSHRRYVSFSSRGPTSDGRIKPNLAAQGAKTALAYFKGGIALGGGTSYSSPLIAGLSACLWQAYPKAHNMKIGRMLQRSAHQYNTPDNKLGFGIPNVSKAFELLKADTASESSPFQLYPNPFNNHLYFSWHSSQNTTMRFQFYDIRGVLRAHFQKDFQKDQFYHFNLIPLFFNGKLGNLESGLYVLKVKEGSQEYVFEIIKQ